MKDEYIREANVQQRGGGRGIMESPSTSKMVLWTSFSPCKNKNVEPPHRIICLHPYNVKEGSGLFKDKNKTRLFPSGKWPNLAFGTLPIGKLHIWKVADWEIVYLEVALRKNLTP